MKANLKHILIALTCALCARQALAVEAVTESFGGSTTVLHGTGEAFSPTTFFSLRGLQPIAAAGTVSTISGPTLTDSMATWTDDQYDGANGAFYVEFDSGLTINVVGTSASAKSLTLAGSIEGLIAPGAAYRVHPHTTISSLFGPNDESGLNGGLNMTVADNVVLHNPANQQTLTYFYYNGAPAFAGWYDAFFNPAGNAVIEPEQGVIVQRKSAGDVVLSTSLYSKATPTITLIPPGYVLLGTLRTGAGLTLDASMLYTGDPTTGFGGALNQTTGDNLVVLNSNGSTSTYWYFFQSVGFPSNGWLDSSFNPAGSVVLPAGKAFFIVRKAPRAAFDWTMPGQ